MTLIKAALTRAYRTIIQSAIGAAASAAIVAIGSAQTMDAVDWAKVASTACLAAIVSLLMSAKGLPEVGE